MIGKDFLYTDDQMLIHGEMFIMTNFYEFTSNHFEESTFANELSRESKVIWRSLLLFGRTSS